MESNGRWIIDKRINISEILALVSLGVGLVIWAVSLEGTMTETRVRFEGNLAEMRVENKARHDGVLELAKANRAELDSRLLVTVPRAEYDAMVKNLFMHITEIKSSQAATLKELRELAKERQ